MWHMFLHVFQAEGTWGSDDFLSNQLIKTSKFTLINKKIITLIDCFIMNWNERVNF